MGADDERSRLSRTTFTRITVNALEVGGVPCARAEQEALVLSKRPAMAGALADGSVAVIEPD